jgi:cobalamin-dependent methionine synthase I
VTRYKTDVILFLGNPTSFGKEEDILQSAGVLVGTANEAGIPNERIYIDPGIFHITSEIGRRYTQTLMAIVPALAESFEPPIKTTCWISNVSAGAARGLRSSINSTFLAMLGGVGLSSAFVDVTERETMRTLRLINILINGAIYADSAIEARYETVSQMTVKS